MADVIDAPWLAGGVEQRASRLRHRQPGPPRIWPRSSPRKLAEIDKVEREVRARLTREINYWDARAARLREEERAGKEQRINASNAEATRAALGRTAAQAPGRA